jgi:ATP-binding cassette, subfamily B, bacterial
VPGPQVTQPARDPQPSRRHEPGRSAIVNRARHLLRTVRLLATVAPGRLLAVLLLTMAAALLPAASLAILSWALQGMVDSARAGLADWSSEAALAALALTAASTLTYLFAVGRRYFETLLQLRLRNAVTDRILAKALSLELSHFEDAAVYDSLQRATAGAAFRPYQIFAGLLTTVSSAVTFGTVAALLLSWSPLAATLMIVSPIPLAIAQFMHYRACWRVAHARSADERRLTYLEHLLTHDRAYKEVHLFALGPLFLRRFTAIVNGFYDGDDRLERRHAITSALLAVCGAAAVGAAVLIALRDAMSNGQVGQFAGYITSVVLIQTSMRAFFESVAELYDDALYVTHLFEFLDIPVPTPTPAVAAVPGRLHKGIEFRDVSFTYPGTDTPVLDRLNLFVPAGRCVALVGANGAGKSTIVKLLTRLYEPTAGTILIDDVPITAYDRGDLRRHVGVIFQDFMEYEAPARENIGFGRVECISDRRRATWAAEQAGAVSFLDRLPDGFDSILGTWFEGGRALSGGQWQKVALARAFFRTAPINVFDEPTAAIDAIAEAEIFARMADAASRSTSLLIAHRISTVRATADHIAVIDRGRVAEEGSHRELISAGGKYARLFRLQAAGYRDEPSGAVTVNSL